MRALIIFIGMAVVILTLIEINERRKAKKSETDSQKPEESCDKDQSCSACGLVDVCDKKDR